MQSRIGSIFDDFVSLFFPNACVSCQEVLPKGIHYLCLSCQYNLPKTKNHTIEVLHIEQKLAGSIHYDFILAYLHFQKKGIVQHLLHELKYNHKEEIGIMLGRWYGHDLLLSGYKDSFDLIVPVPLHPSKERKRGYNQSDAFAKGLSEVLKIPVLPKALKRIKASETQTRKGRVERLKNVSQIFELSSEDSITDQRVLLVDDVLTTGATLLGCGEKIWSAKPKSLSFAVIAATQ